MFGGLGNEWLTGSRGFLLRSALSVPKHGARLQKHFLTFMNFFAVLSRKPSPFLLDHFPLA